MNFTQRRKKYEALVRSLDIPTPFNIQAFCHNLKHLIDKPVHLLPQASQLHQKHIILHEVGHLIFEHTGGTAEKFPTRLLHPDLDPDMVQGFFQRTVYQENSEIEAELIASMIQTRIHRRIPLRDAEVTPDVAELLTRLNSTFQLRREHGYV